MKIIYDQLCSIKGLDLPRVMASYGTPLKHLRNASAGSPQGSTYQGLCPFHEDSSPSLSVSKKGNKWLWHCFGCQAKGTVIDFVMKKEGIPFKAAYQRLMKEDFKVLEASESVNPVPMGVALPEERIQQLLSKVISVYTKNFSDIPLARQYFEERGITDAGLWGRHNIGYSNGRLRDILPNNGTIREDLISIGILQENGRERFGDCVVVPVYNIDGNITTIYGRSIDKGMKKHVFLPRRPTGLWNVGVIKTYPEIILVESVIDALSVEVAGFSNVVAVQGINGVSDKDFQLFKAHGVQRLIFLFDGDESGQKSARRLQESVSDKAADFSFNCLNRCLASEHDPNSYLCEYGADKLAAVMAQNPVAPKQEAVESSNNNEDLIITYGLRKYQIIGLEKGPRKLKATVRVEHAGKLHVDTLDFYSARCRRTLAQDLCRLLEEVPETIEADLTRLMMECEKHNPGDGKSTLSKVTAMTVKEKKEAECFGRRTDLIERVLEDFETCGLVGEESNKLLGYLAMTSRKQQVPLAVLILSSSGAGKTALQDAVCSFCPEEDLQKLTSLTGKALFYKDRLSLKHKVLALEEGEGAQEASYAIRNLISAGELVSESTIKDLSTGRLTTMENKVEGPTAVFLTTTNPEIDPETKSRFFVTSIDESRQQTRRILTFQRRNHLSDGPAENATIDAILRRHRNFQRLLKNMAVKNPYADQLTYGDDRLQGRRDQPKYLNLIKAVAFLRQMVKTIEYENKNGTSVPYIKVDLDDIEIANILAHEILGRSLDELSRPSRDLLKQLDEMVEKIIKQKEPLNKECVPSRTRLSFSRRDIRQFTGWNNTRLHIHLKELVEFEYVIVESGRNGQLYRYRLAYEGQGKNGERFMLGLKEIKELEK